MSAAEPTSHVHAGSIVERLEELLASSEITALVCVDAAFEPCPVPDELARLGTGDLAERRTTERLLEVIDGQDHATLVKAVGIAQRTGMSGCRVRRSKLVEDRPGEEIGLRLFDLLDDHGVMLALIGDFSEEWVDLIEVPEVTIGPRILVHQNDPTGHYRVVDPRTAEVLGWEPSELVGQSGLNFIHPDDRDIALAGWLRVLAGEDGSRQRCRVRTKDDRWLWIEATYTNRLDGAGGGHIRVEQLNIEGEMDALAQARAVASQFETLAQSLPVGVVHLDADGRVVFVNDWVRRAGRVATGSNTDAALFGMVHPADRARVQRVVRRCLGGEGVDFDLRLVAGGGSTRDCRVRARPLVMNDRIAGVIASIEDITESLSLQERLHVQATTDHLTGLPNRAALNGALQELIEQRRSEDARFACLFVDLDDFKLVNDGLGHQAGDAVLVAVAERLRASVRPGDIVARVGGDEFIVICPWASRPEDVTGLAERVMQALRAPLACTTPPTTVTASVGIAFHDESTDQADLVLCNADIAMYEAKRAGGGRWAVYGRGLRESMERRFDAHRTLDDAIRNGELEMHLQPIFDLASRGVMGAEALLRWRHPARGLIMPSRFVDFTARSDLMARLGWWIIEESCRIAGSIVCGGWPDFDLGINLTGAQLAEPGFAARFLSIVEQHGLEPRNITLEVTETALIDDGPAVSAALEAVTDAGSNVALDDFGTGFSSLNHVRDLPVRTLKVDLSFTRRITTCQFTRAIVEAMRDLADKLGFDIVVEGVETEEQRRVLLDMGIRRAQGYLMARPCDEATFARTYAGGEGVRRVGRDRASRR